MKIKKSKSQNRFFKKLRPFLGRRRLPLFFFSAYTILIAVIGLWLAYTLVTPYKRDLFAEKVGTYTNIGNLFKISNKYGKGLRSNPEHLHIDLKHRHLQKLGYIRSVSLQKGILFNSDENDVPAIIHHGDKAYRVRLSLKGRMNDHWGDKDFWSLKIKVRDDQTIFGMKSFAIQHPSTRNYLNEWILHQFFGEAGIAALRYDFVEVDINGTGDHIYALEESFDKRLVENNHRKEGPTFKFNRDFYWENGEGLEGYSSRFGLAQEFWGSDITPSPKGPTLRDSVQFQLFNKAKSLLEAFRQNELTTSQTFDLQKLALFFALEDLFGSQHSASLDNIRFYYNPITAHIEPIVHDNNHYDLLKESRMIGEEKQIGNVIQHRKPTNLWRLTAWMESLFKDPVFYEEYIRALKKVSNPAILDTFFEKYGDELSNKLDILHKEFPAYDFSEKFILYENQKYIREALNPEKLIHAYLNKAESSGQELKVNLTNAQNLPVEILGAKIDGSTELLQKEPLEIIQANISATPTGVQSSTFQLPGGMNWDDSLVSRIKIYSRILGTEKIVETPLLPYGIEDEGYLAKALSAQKSNIGDFDFLKIDETAKTIRFQSGTHTLDKNLIIPKGYLISAKEGTSINLSNGASIVSHSPLQWVGSEENPIIIQSSDSSGQGLIVMDTEKESYLQYVHFDKLSNPEEAQWNTNSPVTFYQAPSHIDHCFFGNNRAGASVLNMVKTDYNIDHSVFSHASANAFAAHYATGTIKNSWFMDSGKDAILLSNSPLTVQDILIDKASENGICVSEKSTLEGHWITIKNTDTALACKDLSTTLIREIEIEHSRVAYAASQQKPEFGGSIIKVAGGSYLSEQIEIPYLIEDNSEMWIGDNRIKSSAHTND